VRRRWLRPMLLLTGIGLALLGFRDGRPATPVAPPAMEVIVMRHGVEQGHALTRGDLAVMAIPTPYIAPGQVIEAAAAVGRRTAIALPAGMPLTSAVLAGHEAGPGARDVAVRLDGVAGIPAGASGGGVADLYLTRAGSPASTILVLRSVLVVSATEDGAESVATLRVGAAAVRPLIQAEASGGLRLVLRPQEVR
jgi:Flp pilus assembly protein CpaB